VAQPPAPVRALLVAMLVLGAGTGGLSACSRDDAGNGAAGGAASGSPVAGAPAEETEQLRQFARCMRQHGVQVADPGSGGGFTMPTGLDSDPAAAQAMESCRPMLPNGGEPPVLSPAELEGPLRFARCMREHGVNVPDPDSRGQLRIEQTDGLSDQAMQDATTACQPATPEGER
jgi:hypothetical protein